MFDTYEKLIQSLLEKGFGSVDHMFSAEVLDGLRKSLDTRYENDDFHLAGIGNKENLQTEKQIRADFIYWLNPKEINQFEMAFFNYINPFVAYLNKTCFAGIQETEFHFAFYKPGAFYKKHIDRFVNDDSRQFSMVLYLNENWETADGGELKLYLPNGKTHTIEPVNGRLIFFESDIPHEVMVSHAERKSVTGWLKTR